MITLDEIAALTTHLHTLGTPIKTHTHTLQRIGLMNTQIDFTNQWNKIPIEGSPQNPKTLCTERARINGWTLTHMEKKIRLTARKGGISGINGLHHCVRNAQKPPTTLSVHPDLTHTEQSTANLSFTHTHITARLFSGFAQQQIGYFAGLFTPTWLPFLPFFNLVP